MTLGKQDEQNVANWHVEHVIAPLPLRERQEWESVYDAQE
jgi:hypothetical protein